MDATLQQDLRQHPITRNWTICAPARTSRPSDVTLGEPSPGGGAAKGCPFCTGNEHMLPGILYETQSADGWQTRVVPNKYPALVPEAKGGPARGGLFGKAPAYGRQEVIVETPRHDAPLACLSPKAVRAVIETYLARYHAIRQDDATLIPFLFRNHGSEAGASLAHPHSQLIATAVPPPAVVREEEAARERYDELSGCAYCALLEREVEEGARVVLGNDAFVAFVPYAAAVPYELWILPRRHRADFGGLPEDEQAAFAEILQATLARLRQRLGDPDYNFYIRSSLDYGSTALHLHWHTRIIPRTTKLAGFEWSTGMHINPSLPEGDAAFLRGE